MASIMRGGVLVFLGVAVVGRIVLIPTDTEPHLYENESSRDKGGNWVDDGKGE
jgi:hypothetical protein